MELEEQEKAYDAARSIVKLAREGGADEVEWLKDNSFLLYGLYEAEARKHCPELSDEIIDLIDKSIRRRLGNE